MFSMIIAFTGAVAVAVAFLNKFLNNLGKGERSVLTHQRVYRRRLAPSVVDINLSNKELCTANGVIGHEYLFWTPMIVFEVFLCCLLVSHAAHAYWTCKEHSMYKLHLVRILVRDSLLYYVL